jgi:hypothetical protein
MKRLLRAIVLYGVATMVFAGVLAVELGFVVLTVLAVGGIVVLFREPVATGVYALGIWKVAMVGLFGAMALVSGWGAVKFAYACLNGWKSTSRLPTSPTT